LLPPCRGPRGRPFRPDCHPTRSAWPGASFRARDRTRVAGFTGAVDDTRSLVDRRSALPVNDTSDKRSSMYGPDALALRRRTAARADREPGVATPPPAKPARSPALSRCGTAARTARSGCAHLRRAASCPLCARPRRPSRPHGVVLEPEHMALDQPQVADADRAFDHGPHLGWPLVRAQRSSSSATSSPSTWAIRPCPSAGRSRASKVAPARLLGCRFAGAVRGVEGCARGRVGTCDSLVGTSRTDRNASVLLRGGAAVPERAVLAHS
jgi:hypothetical protein